jgi:hypothetical protein
LGEGELVAACKRGTMLRCVMSRFTLSLALLSLGIGSAIADMTVLTDNTRFCPSWAEAHERSLADLNHGRPPYPVQWKGCIVVNRGTCVDVVDQQEQSTEIVVGDKHWFTDEMPAVVPGRACATTSAARRRGAAE